MCVYLAKVSVVAGQCEIELFTVVVADDPGKHRILIQIVKRAA